MRHRVVILATVLALFPAACDDSDRGWIEVRNRTGRAITQLTITRCGSTTPGPNRLDAGMIPSGGEAAFEVELGCYDVEIRTEDLIPGQWRVDVDRGSRRVILFAEATTTVAA